MLFNSYIFIFLFLPITLLGYYGINHFKAYKTALVWLIGMSLWFYGYFNISYTLILISSVLVNFCLSKLMAVKLGIKRPAFVIGLIFNIGMLVYFKYADFLIENVNAVFKSDFNLLHILLPLGISFFTFQQISYIVDSYKGKITEHEFIYYAAYVTFFPQLIAGPIVLHEELIPAFKDEKLKKPDYENLSKGIYAFILGLSKKVLIADTLSKFVAYGFDNYANINATTTWITILCYSLQIYFDFSGYCDMAVGIGFMFNVKLPDNFNSPYKATGMGDFWDRWHMTLTRFFTRYIYIPLGGNRKGNARTYINMMVVFLISGFWHGANWTFVLWGVLNGLLVVIDRMVGERLSKVPAQIKLVITFVINSLLWQIFRSPSIKDSFKMLSNLFTRTYSGVDLAMCEIANELTECRIIARFGLQGVFDRMPMFVIVVLLIILVLAVWNMKNTQEKVAAIKYSYIRIATMTILLLWSVISLSDISEFLYFNF